MPDCDHTSVGMLCWRDGELLLIERRKPPYGFAPPAGHVDNHGSFEDAARQELLEEVGLVANELHLLREGRKENPCRRPDGSWHYWRVYEVKASGVPKRSMTETKQLGWYSREAIVHLAQRTAGYSGGDLDEQSWSADPGLEPVWCDWLRELGVLRD
jgi:ADP-ribose pyrophosphatase YjhB (NUDIX family)